MFIRYLNMKWDCIQIHTYLESSLFILAAPKTTSKSTKGIAYEFIFFWKIELLWKWSFMKNESQTTIFNAFYKIIIEIVVKLHLFPKETSESVNFKVNQTKEISKISGKRVIHSMYIYQIKTKFVAYFKPKKNTQKK